jgi:DNA anti-recombination protein RmuC
MGNIFKFLLLTSPITALIFFYVFISQQKHDVEIETMNTGFDRSWNEFEASFSDNKTLSDIYKQRAEEADKKLKSHEEAKAQLNKSFDEIRQEMETELEAFELPEAE